MFQKNIRSSFYLQKLYNLIARPRLSTSWKWLQIFRFLVLISCPNFSSNFLTVCVSLLVSFCLVVSLSPQLRICKPETMLSQKIKKVHNINTRVVGVIKEQYHWGTERGSGEHRSNKSNTNNWESYYFLLNMWIPSCMRRSRRILGGTCTYIISASLSFLMPLDLWGSLCVNIIVLLKNRCFAYKWPSPVSQQLHQQFSQRNRNLFQKWREKNGHDGFSKRRDYLHKNKITIISGWWLGFPRVILDSFHLLTLKQAPA